MVVINKLTKDIFLSYGMMEKFRSGRLIELNIKKLDGDYYEITELAPPKNKKTPGFEFVDMEEL
jgi:hypothetical protein